MRVRCLVVSAFLVGLLWTIPVYAQVCQPPPNGLVRYWPANGSYLEAVVGATTNPAGGVAFGAGIFDQAFFLQGGYVQTDDLRLNAGTVEFWLNPSTNSGDLRLYSQTSGSTSLGGATSLGFASPGDVQVWTGFQWLPLAPGGVVPARAWTHLAFVYQAGVVTLYVNGRNVGRQPSRFDFSGVFFGIGAPFLNAFGRTFPGALDEFSVYNRPLTDQEIAALADQSLGPKCLLPTADAGADQSVDEAGAVTLHGSGTSYLAPIDRYTWTQISGPTVTLDRADVAEPSFLSPSVPRGGATLTFQLIVHSRFGASNPDTVNVTVNNVNHAPVAVAQASAKAVQEGGQFTLLGSSSFDPDRDPLTYSWTQISGPPVGLLDPTIADMQVTAPYVGSDGATLTFSLNVSDGEAAALDSVSVFVENVNHPPIAAAGPDQTRDEGASVSLDGSGSTDPDGDVLRSAWVQVSGPAVMLTGADTATPSFVAPNVDPGGALLEFSLTVTDPLGLRGSDSVVIRIQDVNDPPVCDTARPSAARLWPPNHGLVPISILSVSDPNGDRIAVQITGVFQNEPLNGLGDGDTTPDAVITSDGVLLRAERSGTGSGRLYHVSFTATDGNGGSCSGAVEVLVPRDIKSSVVPVPQQWYSSTGN